MEKLIVEVDSREKFPIPFPDTIRLRGHRIEVLPITVRVPYGDYRLACDPVGCVIERKGSQRELLQNLFDPTDQTRALRAFKKLVDHARHPYLLLEMNPSELFSTRNLDPSFDPDDLLSRLHDLIAHWNLSVIWAGRQTDRRNLGRLILHTLCAYALDSGALLPTPDPLKKSDEAAIFLL